MFGSLGFTEILIIILVLVLLFGARRIPELARGLGEGIRTFKSGLHGAAEDDRKQIEKRPEPGEEKRTA